MGEFKKDTTKDENYFCPFQSTQYSAATCNQDCAIFDPDIGVCGFQSIRADAAEIAEHVPQILEQEELLNQWFGADSLFDDYIEEQGKVIQGEFEASEQDIEENKKEK